MYSMFRDLETRDPGPCGGFSNMYKCMCDLHHLPYREEVAWDVDTIYLSHDTKELSLQDFDHLNPRLAVCLHSVSVSVMVSNAISIRVGEGDSGSEKGAFT